MPISSTLYNTFFRRNSVFVSSVFVGAFAFTMAFDTGINAFWDRWNQGKQWKDIRHKYVQPAEEED
ncbi:ubiquinol-cytochrome C reductase [Fomitiporia mediterranea MF3/22]|uniref:ubiquinol-cytochrome C reductase n=1 Tax=Fomitiporia mediterranea (strain MF3/22) TaxID=694068 RepID=UPI0004409B5E|nr:ubiquinol-cytochrome C reductase [Fomitiporia mediterranea MF3/22]EJD01016.1 ubiquinol-cytochrome C reductase [Fomitiporia mediterranea MF3/22]